MFFFLSSFFLSFLLIIHEFLLFLIMPQQLAKILDDPEASSNDRFVALELLKNANVAAGMVLPGCQDTGTAICMGTSCTSNLFFK